MSFGLEVYDQSGNVQFDLGKRYFGSTGEIVLPATSSRYQGAIATTLSIPAYTGFKLWAMNSPASTCYVEYASETSVIVYSYLFYAGVNNYRTNPVTIYYGVFI